MILILLLLAPLVQRHFGVASIYHNPFFRAMEFILGIIVALENKDIRDNHKPSVLHSKIVLALATLLLLLCVSVGDMYLSEPRDYMLMNWVVLPCFILMFFILGNVRFNVLVDKWFITYSSSLSYAFFLAQVFVWPLFVWAPSYYVLNRWFGIDNNIMRIIVSFTICVGFSVFMHECVEKPSTKYLKKQLK